MDLAPTHSPSCWAVAPDFDGTLVGAPRCPRKRCPSPFPPLGFADPFVRPHQLYTALAESDEGRHSAYRTLFADSLPETVLSAIRAATSGGFVLGTTRFERQIAVMAGRRTRRGESGRPGKQDTDTNQLELPSET